MTTSVLGNQLNSKLLSCLTFDVEDWFHILDSPAAPRIEQWGQLESRVEHNLNRILGLLNDYSIHATFFWLGWIAERHKSILRRCFDEGHEIASHGYGHLLPYKIGPECFKDDIERGKKVMEDTIGCPVYGFRATGFGIRDDTKWAFDVIAGAGHKYDSSIFPAARGHGGMPDSQLGPHIIKTRNGPLCEIPISTVRFLGHRLCLFGGGYLRFFPRCFISWGIDRLHRAGHPLIIYVHPREIDPNHQRLPLGPLRRFKCYVNLKSTMPKLQWLCKNYNFVTMHELVDESLAR